MAYTLRRMLDGTTKVNPAPLRLLIVVFVLIGAGFFAATVYTELHASAIDDESEQMEENTLPSIEHLTVARTALHHLENAAEDYAEREGSSREASRALLEGSRAELDHELLAYVALPSLPNERALYAGVDAPLRELDTHVRRLYERVAEKDEAAARSVADHDIRGDVERAEAGLRQITELNAAHARINVARIGAIRRKSQIVGLSLDLVCVVFAIGAGMLVVRAMRRATTLEQAHSSLLSARADELEQFAKRVAHDLLSPLAALSFSIGLIKRRTEGDPRASEAIARADACLRRTQRLVDGIYDFARSGAPPDGRARADVKEAIDGVIDEARMTDGPKTELVVAPFDRVAVTCAPGVLISVLSNLVRNALKYMGNERPRRIDFRVLALGARVRIEVEDNGPGLPLGFEARAFEPYVRAPGVTEPGLGLGLSTVRRLVEAHGGTVGVTSIPDRGCVFWFELGNAETGRAPNSDIESKPSPALLQYPIDQ